MERARHIAQFWNWLPAFRAVAETEHLPRAAEGMGLTAAALSRSVRLLEEALGEPLFDRVGRRLVLNAAGQAFLVRVRDAMRWVHEGTLEIEDAAFAGAVSVSAPADWQRHLVLPALERLRAQHPQLVPRLRSQSRNEDLARSLSLGEVDVVLTDRPLRDPSLHVAPLLRVPRVLARPPEGVSAALVSTLEGGELPPALEARVEAYADDVDAALTLAQHLHCAALVPATRVPAGWCAETLCELPPSALFIAHRRTLGRPGRTEALAQALLDHA